ncbi:MAG TPA: hypothetical protein VNQ32_12350 [Steroidobacteraceae bacterium]|nr:hypothetical protein [Steroidobacteraceae bacterium]
MTTVTTIVEGGLSPALSASRPTGASSAVSWSAIIAGAVAAAALSLILLVLGIGLGLSVVSPWVGATPSESQMTWSTIAWVFVTAFAASGLGGYIAGRLRSRWPSTQQDEVYFRDTAHGFLAWAVATLLTAAVFTSVIGSILGSPDPAVAPLNEITDEARRNAAKASLWIFASLLIGAFAASWLATYGGRRRDLP